MNRVVVTKPKVGRCCMQVCAKSECTDEEILFVCNKENSSGTPGGWWLVYRKNESFWKEGLLPVQCADYSDRKHFIVMCQT